MTEPTADEADALEQQLPPPEGEDQDGAIEPGEVNPVDAAEQARGVRDDDAEDYPHGAGPAPDGAGDRLETRRRREPDREN